MIKQKKKPKFEHCLCLWMISYLCVRREILPWPSESAAGRLTAHWTSEEHFLKSCSHTEKQFNKEIKKICIFSTVCSLSAVTFGETNTNNTHKQADEWHNWWPSGRASPTWLWVYEGRGQWCCQLRWSCCFWGRPPAGWTQRPTGKQTLSGKTSTGSSQGSSSGSGQRRQQTH